MFVFQYMTFELQKNGTIKNNLEEAKRREATDSSRTNRINYDNNCISNFIKYKQRKRQMEFKRKLYGVS